MKKYIATTYVLLYVALITLKTAGIIKVAWWLVLLLPVFGTIFVLLCAVAAVFIASAVYAIGYEEDDIDLE